LTHWPIWWTLPQLGTMECLILKWRYKNINWKHKTSKNGYNKGEFREGQRIKWEKIKLFNHEMQNSSVELLRIN
jgi:hypothetical protein